MELIKSLVPSKDYSSYQKEAVNLGPLFENTSVGIPKNFTILSEKSFVTEEALRASTSTRYKPAVLRQFVNTGRDSVIDVT